MYYANRILSSKVEKNYSTTKRESLGMTYSIKKFYHSLLVGNEFTFQVDHLALLYYKQAKFNKKIGKMDVVVVRI